MKRYRDCFEMAGPTMSQQRAVWTPDPRHFSEREARLAESEARLRSLIEGLPQLIWRADPAGAWLWASPQWCAFTGFSNLESTADGWLGAVHPDDQEMTRDALRDAVRSGALYVEHRLHHAGSGDWRWFQTRATAISAADGALVEWMGASTEIDALRRLKDNETLLVAELQHRTRNLMAVVQAIAGASEEGSVSIADYRRRFQARVAALSRTQTLLSERPGKDVALDAIVRGELRAVAALGSMGPQVELEGSPVLTIKRRRVQILGLAIHELATNAARHGALSHEAGKLRVRWNSNDSDSRVWLEWLETGARVPDPGAPKGFGRELIEDALTFQLAATIAYDLSANGLTCRIVAEIGAT